MALAAYETFEQSLYEHLVGMSALVAVVGDRIYPLVVPQGATLPYGRIWRVSTPRVRSHDGPSGVARPRIQIDWIGVDNPTPSGADLSGIAQAREAARLCRLALDGYRGLMGGHTVQAVALEDERDLYNDEARTVGRSQDFVIWHREAATVWL